MPSSMAAVGQQHNMVQQMVDVATNPVTTTTTGTVGVWVFVSNNIATVVGVLTALVLLCQLVAWGYKGYKWFAGRKPKKRK